MNFEEHAAKPLLAAAGIAVPRGVLAESAETAAQAAGRLGPCFVKAQVPAGKRGKAGGVRRVDSPAAARAAAQAILGMEIAGYRATHVLVEEAFDGAAEYYAAVVNDWVSKGPLLLFSAAGGLDVEELTAARPGALLRMPIDIATGPDRGEIVRALAGQGLGPAARAMAELLERLYHAYRANDAELVEINPLARMPAGGLIALDCKFVLDDSAVPRQRDLAAHGSPELLSALEAEGRKQGLRYMELDGDVGILGNGAGLTMATIDVVHHYGGRPANFLEIGGDAYTLGTPALKLVLANPRVKSLLINFCGAIARTDVMTEGLLNAWDALKPDLPVFFSIHGTGEAKAVAMVRARLGLEPFNLMDDAVQAAVAAAR